MKLVRFELLDSPGQMRSGLVYDERVYETVGDQAAGIHDLGRVRFHAPVGAIPALRIFEMTKTATGDETATYRYLHAGNVFGPLSEIAVPEGVVGLDFDVYVAAVMQDQGTQIDPAEATGFILGYTLMAVMIVPSLVEAELADGHAPVMGQDVATVIGPFLVTAEDVAEYALQGDRAAFAWPYEITVNQDQVASGTFESVPGMDRLLAAATQTGRVFPAEIIAWPKVNKPALEFTDLGRELVAGDRVKISFEGLGVLVIKIV
jgi:2-keto-4-pentenoate hydratase/2-oxohepta-3-ene-1,7-dioic acid hydratase in catechol pathway